MVSPWTPAVPEGRLLRPQTNEPLRQGAVMAVGAHLLLVGALALGVSWKVTEVQVAEAEVWAEVPTVAAPPPPPPAPAPRPQPVAEPPRPTPAPPPKPAPEPPPPPAPKPDIVVAPEPKKPPKPKPPVEVFESTPPKRQVQPPPKPAPEPQPRPEPRPEPKPAPREPTRAEPKAPATPPGPTAAEREAQRKAHMARMMSELGSLDSTGSDARTAGPSDNYAGRIKARIKPHIVFTDLIQGNPVAVVELRCGPDGRILSSRLVSASGVPAWDAAVLRAIERTEVLPANEQGRVPPVIEISFRPRD